MPELPEVETIVRQLRPKLAGRLARRLDVFDPRLGLPAGRKLAHRIERVEREGKWIRITLRPEGNGRTRAALHLSFHLRMTGRLRWSEEAAGTNGERSLRARLILDRGCLLFQDTRRLGEARLDPEDLSPRAQGLDPISRQFTPKALSELLEGSLQPIKPWLLRQDRLAGIGNIYASEALHAARIHPAAQSGGLKPEQIARLHGAIRQVLRGAIRAGGTTFSDYQDARGGQGGYQRRLAVYGRGDEPCPVCGAPVERVVQVQRSTYFCPRCQKP